jgi:DNA-binding transcriptional MocR family regulator
MAEWIPSSLRRNGPRYLAIVEALQSDIQRGALPSGSRLLPHRDLAGRLGLSIGTVSKAYAEAERRGLVVGMVGRGTFVRHRNGFPATAPATPSGGIPLDLNVPPPGPEIELLAEAFTALPETPGFGGLFDYLPHQGLRRHRESALEWMGPHYAPPVDRILICHGAQHAMSLAFSLVARPGDTVLAECLTYSGMKALAAHQGIKLVSVDIDREGLLPASLEEACKRTGAKVLYTMPTLHSPTATTMSHQRRDAIAEIAECYDLLIIEDNVYNFLAPAAPPPLAALVPDRCFYMTSLSKCVAPGLRVGFVVPPSRYFDRMVLALRATAWMATPATVEVGCRMIDSGKLRQLAEHRRTEAALRRKAAYEILGKHLPALSEAEPAGFHLWLRLPQEWPAAQFVVSARRNGVNLAPPEAVAVDETSPNGVRLCIGAPETVQDLRAGLDILLELLRIPSPSTLSFV